MSALAKNSKYKNKESWIAIAVIPSLYIAIEPEPTHSHWPRARPFLKWVWFAPYKMDSDQDEYFPGLNKKHGFFRVIERNQVSRDEYHKKHELWKEEKKNELDTEVHMHSHICI